MEGPSADSEEKREPAGDIDTEWVDSLKVLDLNRPIRKALGRPRQKCRGFLVMGMLAN